MSNRKDKDMQRILKEEAEAAKKIREEAKEKSRQAKEDKK